MKYVVMPFLRLIIVMVTCIIFLFVVIFAWLRCFWEWDTQWIDKEMDEDDYEYFHVSEQYPEKGQIYWVNKTVSDYIFDRKTWLRAK